jgi:hypothetical protein
MMLFCSGGYHAEDINIQWFHQVVAAAVLRVLAIQPIPTLCGHSARIMGSRKGTYAPSESLRLSLIGVAKWVCKPNMTISEHRSGKNVAPIELPNRVDKMTSWRE